MNMDQKTVLVVDDEVDILRVLERGLSQEGFEVRTARSAEAAIKSFPEMSPRPDLLLTDVVMPGMSGPALAERLRQIDPALKVLFMSGYDSSQVVQRYVVDQGFSLIAKPFTASALREAIEAALGTRNGTGESKS
jgi:two-component system, cell cycle sensor histidine kinase and response regulator CckA